MNAPASAEFFSFCAGGGGGSGVGGAGGAASGQQQGQQQKKCVLPLSIARAKSANLVVR
jgi:hypothetical protein